MFFTCQKESTETVEIQHKSRFNVQRLNHKQIQSNVLLTSKLTNLKRKLTSNKLSKSIYNSEYDFTIKTDNVKFIQDTENGNHSYSFPITRENPTKKNLENLLLHSNLVGGYDAYIIQYGFSAKEYQYLDDKTIKKYNTLLFPIDFDISVINNSLNSKMNYECSETWEWEIIDHGDEGNLVGAENVEPVQMGWVLTGISCGYFDDGGGGSSDTGIATSTADGSSIGGGGGSTSSTGTSIDPSDPNNHGNDPIISAPAIYEDVVQDKPCPGDPVPNPEIVSSGDSGKRGGTFGCTRKQLDKICDGVKGVKNHDGLDIKANVNENAYAMYSGTISSIRNTFSPGQYKVNSFGNFVVLTTVINGKTYNIKYNHLNSVTVAVGSKVNVGDIVGLTGNTGNAAKKSVTPHIHIQVFNSNWSKSLNPEDYLNTKFDSNYNSINNCK